MQRRTRASTVAKASRDSCVIKCVQAAREEEEEEEMWNLEHCNVVQTGGVSVDCNTGVGADVEAGAG